ncbi:hypothetical protein WJX72_010871 [[Myrmecia] bisecta]|uniref:Rhodanese domain-containing protein n=1 Tax=[Myrmecia] bisecta TaxID=41462 RepID=A0AAW1PUI6_9CHLO
MSEPAKAEKMRKTEEVYNDFKRKSFPDVMDVDAQTLHSLLATDSSKLMLIDVRTPEEQQVSRIPGPCMTAEEFDQRKADFKHYTIVTYCTVGARSGKYANVLRQDGFDVMNLKGSIVGWTQQGYPLISESGEATKRVHVFGDQWALQGEGYEPVTFGKAKAAVEGVRTVLPSWMGGTKP